MDSVKLMGVENSLERKYPKCWSEIKARANRLREMGDMPTPSDDELLLGFKSYVAGLPCAQQRHSPVQNKKKRGGHQRVDKGRTRSGR